MKKQIYGLTLATALVAILSACGNNGATSRRSYSTFNPPSSKSYTPGTTSGSADEPYYQYVRTPATKRYEAAGFKNAIGDESFRRGFKARKKLNGGEYMFCNPVEVYNWTKAPTPVWQITQWMSQSLVDPDTPSYYKNVDGTHVVIQDKETNPAKKLEFETSTGDFKMACNATQEYKDNKQEESPYYGGKWWVHFLIEQELPNKVKLSSCNQIVMQVDYKLEKFVKGNMFKDAAECAQFEWYITVQNLNSSSADYGKYQWFGFDMWDCRDNGAESKEYKAGEYGSGVRITRPGSYLYLPDTNGKRPNNTPGTNYRLCFANTLEYIKEDFDQNNGAGKYWANTKWEDLYIGATNIGYEVHNHFDAEFSLSNMGIFYK